MAEYTTNAYKNEKRRQAKTLTREGMFISDYVQTKYRAIYQEAAELYNTINRIHPRKPDLRRTFEYRQWKNNIAVNQNNPVTPIPRQKNREYVHVTHRDIPIPLAVHPDSILTVLNIESSREDSQTTPQPPESQTSPQPPESQTSPQSPESQTSPQTPESPPTIIQTPPKTMQLKIPLIPSSNISKAIQDSQKIVEVAYTETVLDEGNPTEMLSSSILDEVPQEIIDKIVADLRQDPGLNDIMTDIENQMHVEEEILGLNIDIPDLVDPLEEELQNIFW